MIAWISEFVYQMVRQTHSSLSLPLHLDACSIDAVGQNFQSGVYEHQETVIGLSCMHRIRAQINQLAQEYSAAISEHETADAVVAVSQPSTCPHIFLSLSCMAGCMLF